MSDTINIPKFRTTTRLVQYVRRNRIPARLPADSERCFFRSKETPERVSANLVAYAVWVGPLGPELESLLDEQSALTYARDRCRKAIRPSDFILDRIRPRDLLYLSQYWCQHFGRLPERLERKIVEPSLLADYASRVGPLEPHLEDLILQDGDAVMKYIDTLQDHQREISDRYLRALVGRDGHFVKLATQYLNRRLPDYLEESISSPEVALNYARHVVKGRLPAKVEEALQRDHRCAVKYAFEVIRGMSDPRLPDSIHAFVVMKSFENPNDGEIRRYIQEVDRLSKKADPQG